VYILNQKSAIISFLCLINEVDILIEKIDLLAVLSFDVPNTEITKI
jgi:hypothetical protein